MDVGTTLKSRTKTAESVQPGIGAFDDPTYLAKTAAVRFTASGNRCGNPGSMQRPAIFVVVVSPIGIDPARLAQGRPRKPRTGGLASTSGSSCVMSLRFAPVRMIASGMPLASVAT